MTKRPPGISLVAEVLAKHLNAQVLSSEPIKAGWAGEVVAVGLADSRQFIVKTYQSSPQGRQSLEREWGALKALSSVGFPVPEPVLLGEASGTGFVAMRKIDGRNLWDVWQTSSESERDQQILQFSRLLSELHALPIRLAGPLNPAAPSRDFVLDELGEIAREIETHSLGYLSPVVQWLGDRRLGIAANPPSLLHRDYHPWNVLVDPTGKMHVIDWRWGIGDRRFDLAWTQSLMDRSGFATFGSRFLDAYCRIAAFDPHDFEFFVVLATLRWAVNVLVSMRTGDDLNSDRQGEFAKFIAPLLDHGFHRIKSLTSVEVQRPRSNRPSLLG